MKRLLIKFSSYLLAVVFYIPVLLLLIILALYSGLLSIPDVFFSKLFGYEPQVFLEVPNREQEIPKMKL